MNMNITISSRIARVIGSPQLVCGNSDYTVTFSFDSEWDAYAEKTAQFCFVRNGKPQIAAVDFTGTSCSVPVLSDVDFVEIGVTAGKIRTTTPARVPCLRCVTDAPSTLYTPPRDIYNEIMDALQAATNPLPELPSGYVFVVSAEGSYITASDGSYMIAKES
jgi:hypothetical protein